MYMADRLQAGHDRVEMFDILTTDGQIDDDVGVVALLRVDGQERNLHVGKAGRNVGEKHDVLFGVDLEHCFKLLRW